MADFIENINDEYKDKLPKKILKEFKDEAESKGLNKKQAEEAISLIKQEFDK
ncbi:hypothetical protein HYT58_01605 [Candidatus Woesearchaeota archaeon]|nr:hypothetical protein [Candidatus Woesearchaeota archaeon]